jgi:hypothetical protein
MQLDEALDDYIARGIDAQRRSCKHNPTVYAVSRDLRMVRSTRLRRRETRDPVPAY